MRQQRRMPVAAIDRIVAPDYTLIGPSGEVVSRAQALADLKSGADKYASLTMADVKVRVFGNAAVVTGRATVKEQYKGKDVSGQLRYTDVFVKRNGRWQAVATHSESHRAALVPPAPGLRVPAGHSGRRSRHRAWYVPRPHDAQSACTARCGCLGAVGLVAGSRVRPGREAERRLAETLRTRGGV